MPRRLRLVDSLYVAAAASLLGLHAGCISPAADDRARLFNEDGVSLYSKGEYRSALESFDLALTLKPQDTHLLFNVAQCYDRLGDAKQAEHYYGTCLVREPKHGDARLALVDLLYRTNREAEANRQVTDWLEQNPKAADAFVLDARRLRQEKALPQCQGRLEQALNLEPQNRRALTELAVLYEAMGAPERAFVLYERILEREPNQTQIAQRLDQLKSKGVRRPLPD